LLVDGKIISKLRAGEELHITLPENAKTLTSKIDWCGSNKFSLPSVMANDSIEVKNAISNKTWIPFFFIYIFAFKKNSYLSISRAT